MWSLAKIKFTCPKCSESFSIQNEYFNNKDNVVCCCCGTKFPDEIVSEIKLAISHLSIAYKKGIEDKKNIFEFDFIPVPVEEQYIHHIRQE